MNFDINEVVPIVIIVLTAITSIKGFDDMAFFDRYKFNVGAILDKPKQWDRLITSAMLHGDYLHLAFNMYTLYIFSEVVIFELGLWQYMVIYFAAIIGGGLLSLWMHRKESYYSAIGASGGVMGILFAAIALYPKMTLRIMFAVPMEAWIFGLIYLGYSIYGMYSRQGNIGHDAHIGGAIAGLGLVIMFAPKVLEENMIYIGIMILPLIVLAYFVLKKK